MDKKYQPPKVWKWEKSDGKFSNINRPTSGATFKKSLKKGERQLQLHSLATPNGVKVNIILEELIESGVKEAEYDAYPINILEGEQFSSGFVEINPNSKIPALVDFSSGEPLAVFESGSILLYLAEKFNKFIPSSLPERVHVQNWLFWQMGSAPYVGGGFGHFYAYAPEKIKYCIDRFTMETKRQLDVLDKQLEDKDFIGTEYSIADMAIFPWYGSLVLGELYEASEFLQVDEYKNLQRWAKKLSQRPAIKRAKLVNKTWGDEASLPERHGSEDFKNIKI